MKAFFFPLLLLVSVLGFLPLFGQPSDLAGLEAKAAKGDTEAELELSRLYYKGTGVPRDFGKAAALLVQAAAQGNGEAMYGLGYLFHHGQGVPKDDASAQQWYQKAADKGVPAAELELGLDYFHGENGLSRDYVAAAKWLELAADPRHAPAQRGPADNALGNMYEYGEGVPSDGHEAVAWYTTGAELGDAKARFNLGRIDDEGILVKRDPAQSYMWLKLAAFQGEPLATHLISEYLAAKHFSADQIAEGDKRAAAYQRAHHQTPLAGPVPTVVEPEAMGPAKVRKSASTPSTSSGPSAH
jgi:TPR repeat protein